jgi:hypothetical protein
MRVLRFIWRGVLAFDRIASRIPQLVQPANFGVIRDVGAMEEFRSEDITG